MPSDFAKESLAANLLAKKVILFLIFLDNSISFFPKILIKKFLFLIALMNLILINSFASSEILPLKKPIQSKEVTKKKLLIDVVRPLPKPITKVETKKTKEKVIVKKKRIDGIILPKKKPLIAGSKKVSNVKISNIDF